MLSLIGISQNVEMSNHWCVTNSKHLSFSETLLFLWSHARTTHSKILLVVWRECQEEDSSPLLHGDKHWQEKKKVYLWNVSKITPNRGCWLYTAKHTNDARFKGAAQKRVFRVYTHQWNHKNVSVYSHKNLHLPKTTQISIK